MFLSKEKECGDNGRSTEAQRPNARIHSSSHSAPRCNHPTQPYLPTYF